METDRRTWEEKIMPLPPRDRNMKEQSMENKNDNSKNNKWKKMSVFLSLVLRHQPDAAGITLD